MDGLPKDSSRDLSRAGLGPEDLQLFVVIQLNSILWGNESRESICVRITQAVISFLSFGGLWF
jgi:hypothetical protein